MSKKKKAKTKETKRNQENVIGFKKQYLATSIKYSN